MKIKLLVMILWAATTSANAEDLISGLVRGIGARMECTPESLEAAGSEQKNPPTRLELRQMQTRKFMASPDKVAKAIREIYKDQGLSCPGAVAPMYSCEGVLSYKSVGGVMKGTCLSTDGRTPGKYVKSQIGSGYESIPCRSRTINYDEKKPVRDKNCHLILLSFYDTTYEFETNAPQNTETVLRIRIKRTHNTLNDRIGWDTERQKSIMNADVYDPEVYNAAFKEIADGLFIDAIKLTPAEMN